MNVHPSQRRFACESCKKHKARCQRIQQTDPKCSRCAMLGVECDPGHQKKVGRPKRSESISVHKVLKSSGTSSKKKFREANKEHHQPQHSPQSLIFSNGSFDRLDPMLVLPQTRDIPITLHASMSGRTHTQQSPPTAPLAWGLQPWVSDERLLVDASNETSPVDQYATMIMPPFYSSPDDVSDPESEWPDISTIPLSLHADSLAWLSPPTPTERDRGPKLTGVMYFNTKLRTVVNEPASLHYATTNHSELPDIADTLSRIGQDLDLRRAAVRCHRSVLSLDVLIYRQGPLFIDGYTLGEFLISTSQDFLHILTRLQASRKWKTSTSFRTIAMSPECLPHALAYTISSIFSQLISFCELFLEHLTGRIERASTQPVTPIPGLTLNGKPLDRPCDQGVLFCNIVLGILEELENVLGFGTDSEGTGLLSTKQIDDLWSHLDCGEGVVSGYGIMQPADVKALFRKAAAVFGQLSLKM